MKKNYYYFLSFVCFYVEGGISQGVAYSSPNASSIANGVQFYNGLVWYGWYYIYRYQSSTGELVTNSRFRTLAADIEWTIFL